MNKNAIIFMDYNETFDDVSEGKGYILFRELLNLDKKFDDMKIVVITSATKTQRYSISGDLISTLSYFPKILKDRFCYLLEDTGKHISEVKNNHCNYLFTFDKEITSKTEGVENFMQYLDKENKIFTCIFVGNSDLADIPMLDAQLGNRQKFMVLANRRSTIKTTHPIYKLSMNPPKDLELRKDIVEKIGVDENFIIKSTNNSYGVGKGLAAVAKIIEEKEK